MNFSNKYIFWGTWILLITILSGINNYYFYSHVERSSARDAKQLDAIVSTIKQNSKNEQYLKSSIINVAKAFVAQAHYNRSMKILNIDNKSIWEYKSNENRIDTVAGSDIQIIIPNNGTAYKVEYSTYLDIPAFMISVFKSMTFSASDILSTTYQEGLKSAIKSFEKSYWYRSRPG